MHMLCYISTLRYIYIVPNCKPASRDYYNAIVTALYWYVVSAAH